MPKSGLHAKMGLESSETLRKIKKHSPSRLARQMAYGVLVERRNITR